MLKIGDKIKYVKASWLIDIPLGTVMTVTDIKGVIVSAKADYVDNNVFGTFRCVMSYDEIKKYFEKVVETETKPEAPKRVWTEWKAIEYECQNAITNCDNTLCAYCKYNAVCNRMSLVEYRTNGKKVMVRYKTDNKYIKAEATCYKTDTFDLIKGLKIACTRLGVKIAKYHLEQIIKEIG